MVTFPSVHASLIFLRQARVLVPKESISETMDEITIDVHGATSTNSFSARSSKGQSSVHFVFNFNQSIQDHWSTLFCVDFVSLSCWFCIGFFLIKSINFKFDNCVQKVELEPNNKNLPSGTLAAAFVEALKNII
jgi:hypothetical protein